MRWFWNSLIGFCLLMCACGTKYIPLEVVRYDSLKVVEILHDSVYVHDSVTMRGDTVVKYKYKYVYRNVVDTLYVERVKEVEVPVPVERKLSWWERQKINFGGWVLLMVAVYVVYRMVKRVFKGCKVD